MKKVTLALLASMCLVSISTLAQEGFFQLSSGQIKLPNTDGSFSDVSSQGHTVLHTYYHISQSEYSAFVAADSKAIYEAHEANSISGKFYDTAVTAGFSRIFPEDDFDLELSEDYEYFAAIYVYETDNRTFYITSIFKSAHHTESEDEFDWYYESVYDIGSSAPRWRYVGDDIPAEPPSITCTALSVADGVITATYSISDFSRLGEIVENGIAPVRIAQDVAGTVGTTTLNATVTATDETASAFTVSFDTPTGWTTLFLFGFGEAE